MECFESAAAVLHISLSILSHRHFVGSYAALDVERDGVVLSFLGRATLCHHQIILEWLQLRLVV